MVAVVLFSILYYEIVVSLLLVVLELKDDPVVV